MWTIYKKELKTYFLSPIGYVAVGLFLAIYSLFFFLTTIQYGVVDLGNLYYATARYGLLLIVPILTMRMFAEERKNGTEQLLLTSPRSVTSIVLGKFLAAVTIILVTLIVSIMYFVIVSFFGKANIVTVLVTMLGFLLLGMAAISFGMLASSITENQIIAAIITIAFLVMPWFLPDISSIFSSINLIDKFMKFPYGLISITDVVGLLSFTVMCIIITILLIKRRKTVKGKSIEVKGATEHNLKNISVKFPLGVFNCVTGVSGSGKSTLVNEILYKTITKQLNGSNEKPGKCKEVVGIDKIDKIINIDQSPIGRTPRSNPATYTGVFDTIREIFANTNEAKLRGYQKGRFSFNVQGGRCEACNGDGLIKIEMHFLPDIYVPCEVCKGKRYNHETLEVKYKGKTIADVLDMTVEEALDFFSNIPKIKQKIQTLYDVGLGYIKLGQPSTTLSGGEAQRVKLATELSKRATGKTLYILDEPTTGLHIADVHRLVNILQRLVDTGNTIIVIEHNLDLIKTADYIIDLGPEGGDGGGEIVAVGTPEQICKNDRSYTGKFLKKYLEE